MKKIMITITFAIVLSGALAHAGYECQSVPQGTTISVLHQKFPSRGTNAKFILQQGGVKKYFVGILESEDGYMLSKKTIHIYPFENENTLTIVSKPKNCGRGFCDPINDKIIKAVLKIANSETTFYCNETNN